MAITQKGGITMTMHPHRSILVATDLTPASDRVLRTASSIAALTDAPLHVLHVQEAPPAAHARWLADARPGDAEIEAAEVEVEAQLRRAIPPRREPIGRMVAVASSVSGAIHRHARAVGADLIVLGPHRGAEGDRSYLGTTADRVIRTSQVPCLIVRDVVEFPVRRIGVLSDFSPAAEAALETAIAWAGAFSGGSPDAAGSEPRPQVVVAHIAWPAADDEGRTRGATQIHSDLRGAIDRVVARRGASGEAEFMPEVLWSRDVGGAVADWIRARAVDLVVLGTHGISGPPSAPLGSLASTVARTAPTSVLLVPPGPASGSVGGVKRGEARMRRVVTAVDFHESSQLAAEWTMRHLAPDADHTLVHVVDIPELPLPLRGLRNVGEQAHLAAGAGARQRLEELRDRSGRANVGLQVAEGRPATEIVRLATELGADLIVVGEQGPRRGVGALLGSTAERVLLDSPVPVLLARKVGAGPPGRLVAAVDGSPVSEGVLAWTRFLVERFGATATVLNVIDRLLLADELTQLPSAEVLGDMESGALTGMQRWITTRIEEVALPASRVKGEVVLGDPSYEIITYAARVEADLVLIGSRGGRGGSVARTPLIGRVVNKVVRSASCSVLVIPDGVAVDAA